jgi:tricorn protease
MLLRNNARIPPFSARKRAAQTPANIEEIFPKFSPDGKSIAFTGDYDGNTDVFVMPAAGGEPRRLTYHPGADLVLAWTPDGKKILFRSTLIFTPKNFSANCSPC